MNPAVNRLGWPVYILFILAMCSLVVTISCFVRAHQVGQQEGNRLQSAQSQQLLVEQMLLEANNPDPAPDVGTPLMELVSEFETLQLATGSTEVTDSWVAFRQQLLDLHGPEAARANTSGEATLIDPAGFNSIAELCRALRILLIDTDAPQSQIEAADHLYQLASSVETDVAATARSSALSTDKSFARGPWLVFDQLLSRFEAMADDGSLLDQNAIGLIAETRSEYLELDQLLSRTMNADNPAVNDAARVELKHQHSMLAVTLANFISTQQLILKRQNIWFRLGLLMALISVALYCLLAVALWRDARRWNDQVQHENEREQASILQLLDEISALADGDLNTRATVSADHTGAIADSINYAVTELKRLVAAITNSADRVTVAVEETGATAQQLAKASSVQSREIQRSATYLTAMADTMGQMSQRSNEASQIASQSVEHAVLGRQSVDQTKDGMNRIRSQIQQTSGLLKRLGESSQKIGDIVGLIDEVAGRTRLIALNAVIQSNSGDDQKHRFATISDAVQSLSVALKESSKDIAVLVDIIQDDARAAMLSMEHTTEEVVNGTTLANQAGVALKDIEFISRRLSVVVEHLSQKTHRQSDVVNQLSVNMGVINEVTRRSAHGLQLSAGALDDLRKMASELRDGVEDFVLPPVDERWAVHDNMVGRPLLKKREFDRPTELTVRDAAVTVVDD